MTKLIIGKRGVPIISRNHRCVKPPADRSREKVRKCLTCRSEFLSQHAGVRMCDSCRKGASDDTAYTVALENIGPKEVAA